MLAGTAVYAALYERLERKILHVGEFGRLTLPQLFNVKPWPVIAVLGGSIVLLLVVLEFAGL
jgi:hypothetical protein